MRSDRTFEARLAALDGTQCGDRPLGWHAVAQRTQHDEPTSRPSVLVRHKDGREEIVGLDDQLDLVADQLGLDRKDVRAEARRLAEEQSQLDDDEGDFEAELDHVAERLGLDPDDVREEAGLPRRDGGAS